MIELGSFILGAVLFLSLAALWLLIGWARELAAYEDAEVSNERLRRDFP